MTDALARESAQGAAPPPAVSARQERKRRQPRQDGGSRELHRDDGYRFRRRPGRAPSLGRLEGISEKHSGVLFFRSTRIGALATSDSVVFQRKKSTGVAAKPKHRDDAGEKLK